MTQDAYLKSVFRPPPLTAYRRQKISRISLLDKKDPTKEGPFPQIYTPGVKKCEKQCRIYPFIMDGKKMKENYFTWYFNNPFQVPKEYSVHDSV